MIDTKVVPASHLTRRVIRRSPQVSASPADYEMALGPDASSKVISATLRKLEHHQLITRRATDDHTILYALTPLGKSLDPVVAALSRWSREHRSQLPDAEQVE